MHGDAKIDMLPERPMMPEDRKRRSNFAERPGDYNDLQ